MNRSLKLSMLVALALGTGQTFAMSLGQIQIKSALGQPLLAEIPLHPANPSELKNLTVKLASSEEFARAGIVGGRTSIPLHFSVADTGAGHPVIRVTSSAAVDNPFLDLLIEVRGSGGKSVREFAILLDPPHSPTAAPAAAPAQQVASPSQRAAHRAAQAPPRRSTPASVPASQAAAVNGKYGPVKRGQTLSGIARNTTPPGVDIKQMMLALQQANPDAFYRENINALKSGAILRVPTAAEAQAKTLAAAVAEVRRQNSDWRAGTPGKPSVIADAAARAPASTAAKSSDNGDRLALVPAKDGGGSGAIAQGGDGPGTSASGVRQDLMRVKENVVSLQQQGTDLKARLKDLADINSKNERLLSLKNNEIAELQSKLAAARKTAGLPPVAAPASVPNAAKPAAAKALADGNLAMATASTSANPAMVPASSGSSAMASTAMGSTASAPKAGTPVPVVPAAPVMPVKAPVAKKVSTPAVAVEQPWYMQTWAWAVGAGAVLLLILLAMLGRRRDSAAGGASKASLADQFGSAPAADTHLLDDEDFDQEELLDQLAEHPDAIGLHLELVTLYYSRRDVEHFEAAAEAMYAHITDPEQDEWQDVLHMGEDLVPEHPLFDHHPELPASEEAQARREFDIDDYASDDYASNNDASSLDSSAPPLPVGSQKVSEHHLNFDLTPLADEESPIADNVSADDQTVVAPLVDAVAVPDMPIESKSESSWQFNDSAAEPVAHSGTELGEFSDDPIDTKLDLARAYLDMGDADGARAMLGEVMKEGSQMQQDTAKRLLDNVS